MIRRKAIGNRIWAVCIALLLCLSGAARLSAADGARAESDDHFLRVHLEVKPAELVEPGDVVLSFTVVNPASTDARNVYLSSPDGLQSEPIGQIAAGETQSFSRQHSVTQAELDAGEIRYTLSHDDPADAQQKINYSVIGKIARSDMRPDAEFTRQFSSRRVLAGGTVTVTYRVRNTGNVALSALRVQDALGDFTGRVERLEVGESRTLISRVSLSADAVSAATLNYSVDGLADKLYMETLSDVTIGLAHAQIDAALSAIYSSADAATADVTLVLLNLGDADYRSLCVTDDIYGGVIADEIDVPSGAAPVEISRACPVRAQAQFRWRVTGVSETGSPIDFLTDTVTLLPRQADGEPALSLQAWTDMPRIRRSGDVTLKVRIENIGGADMENAVLSEAALGEIRAFAVIAAGATVEREVVAHVDRDARFLFSLNFVDAEGARRSLEFAPVDVVIAADGALPEGAKPRLIEFSGNSIKIAGSSMYAVLLIAGITALLALMVMLWIASRRARLQKQLRSAARRQRRREQGGRAPAARRKAK